MGYTGKTIYDLFLVCKHDWKLNVADKPHTFIAFAEYHQNSINDLQFSNTWDNSFVVLYKVDSATDQHVWKSEFPCKFKWTLTISNKSRFNV